ncbi:MAG: SDR family oxidoreductase [Acidimicrobiia bacterium]|nr:SDR family oxidoreductase [Acidimicrobiia bacterium]
MDPTTGMELTDQRVLITGGSTGIGAATARRAVTAGARVVAVARRKEPLDRMAEELGPAFTPLQADLANPEALEGLTERVVVALGGLDIIVNCAARADWMPFEQLDHDTFNAMFGLNVWAPLHLLQQALPHLRASEHPVVVMVGSVDAERPSPGAVAYGATKSALTAATVALSKEVSPVRVVQVNPGLIDTPMIADIADDLAALDAPINLAGRLGRPEEIAGLIHYLISPLGRFANGNVFRVDGGALVMGPFDATRQL